MRSKRLLALMLALAASPLAAQEQCLTCLAQAGEERPLTIEIDSGITFSRLALTGGDSASAGIDPRSGEKRTEGGVMDLGGQAISGKARISGQPNRAVRVILPSSVTMTSTTGGTAELTDFVTDLPPFPVLDSAGQLEFGFGGSLKLNGAVGGSLRGRIPITVDYN